MQSKTLSASLALIALVATTAVVRAQDAEIKLRCSGTQESVGSKFPRSTKPLEFDLKANPSSGQLSGGFSELISSTPGFAPKVSDSEFTGSGSGFSSLLPGVALMPIASYRLNRHTGTYWVSLIMMFDDKAWTEYTIRATCDPAIRKF